MNKYEVSTMKRKRFDRDFKLQTVHMIDVPSDECVQKRLSHDQKIQVYHSSKAFVTYPRVYTLNRF